MKRTCVDAIKKDLKQSNLKVNHIEGIYLKPLTTTQMISLNLEEKFINSFCELGKYYPELSLAIMLEGELE